MTKVKVTKAALNAIGIHNSHNFCTAGGGRVYVDYIPAITGRGYRSARWQVIGIRCKTDPDGHWQDYGHKTFTVHERATKPIREAEAKDWATRNYLIAEWKRDPFGGWQEPKVYDGVVAKLSEGR